MDSIITTLPARSVVGLQSKFISAMAPDSNANQIIPQLWKDFLKRVGEIPGVVPGVNYGVVFPHIEGDKAHPWEMAYIACIEVVSAAKIPAGLVARALPAGKYALFKHQGPIEKLQVSNEYIYKNWLPKSGYQLRNGPHLEIYGPGFKGSAPDSELELAIPIS